MRRALLFLLILAIGVSSISVLGASKATAATCYAWSGQSPVSLQTAMYANQCVTVAAGTWPVAAQLVVPFGHSISGAGTNSTILKATAPWDFTQMDAVVQSSDERANVQISNLTVDANHLATYAVGYRGMTVTNVTMKNARCNGVGIVGKNVHISYSTVTGNGATCLNSPPGAGIYVEANFVADKHLAPQIDHNNIYGNTGPGLDVNGAYDGIFTNNHVYDNGSWAAVSLYGSSNWNVSANTISQPVTRAVQPYHPYCNKLPDGAGSVGIFLCQDTDVRGLTTTGNGIAFNRVSGYYGIVSIGADELRPYWAPRDNGFSYNNTYGSYYGCVDDFRPGQWLSSKNSWSNNQCSGPNTGPQYF
jgi:hypothetical protein